MFRTFIFLTLITAFAAAVAVAQQTDTNFAVKASKVVRVRGNVLTVEDSDRVKMASDDGNVYSVLLVGVDAPDEKQSYYKKARKRLADLVEGKEITAMLRTADSGDAYAVIFSGADDVGLKLIQEGLAWYSPNRSRAQNAADRQKYIEAETAARSAKLGLWQDKAPVAPWTFRGEKIEPVVAEAETKPVQSVAPKAQPVPGRTYILGPRGGCYYLSDQGIKVYVKDKTLCDKPQP